jgi:hypothetical protein
VDISVVVTDETSVDAEFWANSDGVSAKMDIEQNKYPPKTRIKLE